MCPALLNHGLPSVGLHPPLFLLSPPLSSISLSALHALQALLTRTLRIIYQNYPNSLLTCPASLSLSLSSSPQPPLHFIAFGNSLLLLLLLHSSYLLLSYSFIQKSLSASHSPLCLSPSSWFLKPQRQQWFTGWPSSATSKGWLAQFLLYISTIVI